MGFRVLGLGFMGFWVWGLWVWGLGLMGFGFMGVGPVRNRRRQPPDQLHGRDGISGFSQSGLSWAL